MNYQKQLLYISQLEVTNINSPKIRGVTACWKGNKAIITFYYEGEITQQDVEIASDACGEIIAHFPDGMLEENYIRLDYPKPLPNDPFFAHHRCEK